MEIIETAPETYGIVDAPITIPGSSELSGLNVYYNSNVNDWFLSQIKTPIKFVSQPSALDDGAVVEIKSFKMTSLESLKRYIDDFNNGDLSYFYTLTYHPSNWITSAYDSIKGAVAIEPKKIDDYWTLRAA